MPRNEELPANIQEQVDWAPKRLRELRESAGFSRQAVAAELGVNTKRLADVELGRYTVRWSTVCRFLAAIGVTPDEWISGCPGSFDRRKLPAALEKAQQVNYLIKQLNTLEIDQLEQVNQWLTDRLRRSPDE